LRRTRIVATLGPATDRPGVLEALLRAGLDVVRINFSHGTAEEHAERIARVRRLASARAEPLGVLADLPGPKLRVRLTAPLELSAGQVVTVATTADAPADLHITEPEAIAALRSGQRVLLDDGRLLLRAVRAEGERVVLAVEAGGTLLPNKGLNLPDTPLPLPAVTDRDRDALTAAAAAGVDWLALSFVRAPGAADELRAAARAAGLSVPVLAKVERPEAVERAADIVAAFDGIMVARGDLGVEMPLERVPQVQKALIALARAAAKPVITATDMLDSMRSSPRPTRAEASDVANAVYDGTDALMLSGETAVGQYPVEAVASMDRIARAAEATDHGAGRAALTIPRGDVQDHTSHLTCGLAHDIGAQAIVAPTSSGQTPRLVARHRPQAPIVAPSAHEAIRRQLALVWGVRAVPLDAPHAGEDRLEAAVRSAFAAGTVRAGDRVVALAGRAVEGGANFPTVRVVRVGEGGQSLEP
jgi:pyruvate kinase